MHVKNLNKYVMINVGKIGTPFNEGVYSASFVGQETLSLPKPDVNLSGRRQTPTWTKHTHAQRQQIQIHSGPMRLVQLGYWSRTCCSPSDPSGTNLMENRTLPRQLMESGHRRTCGNNQKMQLEASGRWDSPRLHQTLFDIHSMSPSLPSAHPHKKTLPPPPPFIICL